MIRVHRLIVPRVETNLVGILMLSLGTLVSFVIGAAIAVLIVAVVPLPLPPPLKDSARIAFIMLVTVLAPFFWVSLFNRVRRNKFYGATNRSQRLSSIFDHPDASKRLPHRCVEYLYRVSPTPSRALRNYLAASDPSRVYLVLSQGGSASGSIRYDVPFEPIAITESGERAMSICQQLFVPADQQESIQTDEHSESAEKRRGIITWIIYVFLVAVFVYALVEPLLYGRLPSVGVLVILAILVASTIYTRLLRETKWWIAPAALFRRRSSPLSSRLSTHRFTPDNSCLLIDLHSNQGMVSRNGKTLQFNCSPAGAWLVLAGWLSTVDAPTEEMARQFMGAT